MLDNTGDWVHGMYLLLNYHIRFRVYCLIVFVFVGFLFGLKVPIKLIRSMWNKWNNHRCFRDLNLTPRTPTRLINPSNRSR